MPIRIIVLILLCSVSCARRQYVTIERAPANGEKPVCEGSCTAKSEVHGYCLNVTWESYPTETDFGQFVLKVTPSPNADIAVDLVMPSMGHGSSPVTVQPLEPGTYRVSKVFFSMPGDWEIRFHINSVDKGRDQAIVPYHF